MDRRVFRELHLDRLLLLELAGLSIIGLLTVFSAVKESAVEACWWKQAVWLVFGWVAMVAVARSNYRTLLAHAWIPYGAGLVMLLYLLVAGRSVSGAKSWISLGGFNLQPSEVMKILVLLLMARAFGTFQAPTVRLNFLFKLLVIIGPPTMLVLLQPDFGTALIFFVLFGLGLFLAGLKKSHVVVLAILAVGAAGLMWQYGLKPYQRDRITDFMDPEADPKGSGYQVTQSKIAIGSGGWFGKGWTHGSQSQLDFVPEKHTDFAITVFSEEFGFVGSLAILGLLLAITARCLKLGNFSDDRQGVVLAAGVAVIFALHCMINIGMVIGLLPTTGIPLPLVSYGGSSVISMMVGFGLVLSVTRQRLAG